MFAMLLAIPLCACADYGPGTQVMICNTAEPTVNAVTNFLWLDEYTNLVQAGDATGLQEMLTKGRIIQLPNYQRALVITGHRAVFSTAPDTLYYELRVKQAKLYIRSDNVVSQAEVDDYRAKPMAEQAGQGKQRGRYAARKQAAAERHLRAKTSGLLAVARNLEKSDKPQAALKTYRELVARYPGSVEAKTAAERIKALSPQEMPATPSGS